MSKPFLAIAIALAACAIVSSKASASSDPAACARIAEADHRLACYDRLFPPVTGASTAPLEAELERRRRDFGLSDVQRLDQDPQLAAADVERIEGQVVRITSRERGQRIIVLDNGQSWLLTEGGSRGHLEIGDAVTVRKAALGSFMVVTPSRAALRAKRLQ